MKSKTELPYINARDLVMFPKMTQGLFIGRQPTIDAILYAISEGHKKVLVLSQKQVQTLKPKGLRDMYSWGTVCSVEGSVLLQDRTMKALFTGGSIFRATRIFEKEGVQFAAGSQINVAAKKENIAPDLKLELLLLLLSEASCGTR